MQLLAAQDPFLPYGNFFFLANLSSVYCGSGADGEMIRDELIRDEMSTRKQIFLPFVREVFCNKTKRNGILCNQRLQGIFGGPIGPSIFIDNTLTLKSTVYRSYQQANHDCLLCGCQTTIKFCLFFNARVLHHI